MNQPWIYMCSPSRSPLPPPSTCKRMKLKADLFQFRPRGCRSFWIWFYPKLALEERVSPEEIENSDPFGCSAESLQRRQWQPTQVLLPGKSHGRRSLVGCSPWGCYESDMPEWLHFHFHFHALEKEMATHYSVLAWRIPGMGEPGGLPSMGSHRVRHDWSDSAAAESLTPTCYQY